MSDVVLINLPIQTYIQKTFEDDSGYNPALGTLSICTFLKMNGYKAMFYDLSFDFMKPTELIEKIENLNPSIVGICAYTENIGMAYKLAENIKKKIDTKISIGGPHATVVPQEVIENPNIDFVILGEGEAPFLEILIAEKSKERIIKYKNILGIYYKNDMGHIVKNEKRGVVSDLDVLPIIDRSFAIQNKYKDVINIYTSKGCPGNCIYCSATALSGAKYRIRNIKNVFMEIVMLKREYGERVNRVYFVDDTFTVIKNRVVEFAELIKQYNFNWSWQCESRIDIMTENLLKFMSDSGCVAIQYGIESGSQEVLDKIKKHIDLKYAEKVIKWTFEAEIVPCLSFMVGHYCDSRQTLNETYKFVEKMYSLYNAEIALSYNTPFVGTWQYTHRDDLGIKLLSDDWRRYNLLNPIMETDNLSADNQREAFYECAPFLRRGLRIITEVKKLRNKGSVDDGK